MLVRMKTKIGGYRNGAEWPNRGGTLDVPDNEGRDLVAAGYAEEARDVTHNEGCVPAADNDDPPAEEVDEDATADAAGPKPAKGKPKPLI